MNDICQNIDNYRVTFLGLLDLSKACKRITFHLLLAKLENIGFKYSSCEWFSSYLVHRTQSVLYNKETSPELETTSDVPQGSILGPILFLIYTSELPSVIRHCKYHMYADDLQIYISCDLGEIQIHWRSEHTKGLDVKNKTTLNLPLRRWKFNEKSNLMEKEDGYVFYVFWLRTKVLNTSPNNWQH